MIEAGTETRTYAKPAPTGSESIAVRSAAAAWPPAARAQPDGKPLRGAVRLATTALAAVSTWLLVMPDSSLARGGGTSAGAHAGPPGGHSRAMGVGRGHVRRGGAGLRLRHPSPGIGFIAVEGDPAFYGSEPMLEPGCRVERRQFTDLYGWRVRNVVVCP